MNIKDRMQSVGKAVSEKLPEGYGFFVLCFPLNEPDAQGEYVSNASRADVISTMKNFVDRNPMQEIGKN
jgi:hypothetical protein